MHGRTTGRTALRARGLEVRYGDRVAVQPLDLDVRPGELVAVTGPSGAGKTSLLWTLAGAQAAYAGVVEVLGDPIRSRQDAACRGVALVPQGNALLPALTAIQNLLVALHSVGLHGPMAGLRAEESLAAVGLADVGDHLVDELSGGQQQRVAVARGWAMSPVLMLADEPTSELDAGSRALVTGALRDLADSGTAVLMATHDPDAADEAALDALRAGPVAVVVQRAARNLLLDRTPRANVVFAQRRSRATGRAVPDVDDVLAATGLGERADDTLGALSLGELQLAVLAVALASGPGLLLADEPTSQLHHTARDEVLRVLRRVNTDWGTTIVLVTHDPAVADSLPRTITIRDGRIGGEGRSGKEFAVVTADGFLPLPAAVLEALPPGTLVHLEDVGGSFDLSAVEHEAPGPA